MVIHFGHYYSILIFRQIEIYPFKFQTSCVWPIYLYEYNIIYIHIITLQACNYYNIFKPFRDVWVVDRRSSEGSYTVAFCGSYNMLQVNCFTINLVDSGKKYT